MNHLVSFEKFGIVVIQLDSFKHDEDDSEKASPRVLVFGVDIGALELGMNFYLPLVMK